MLSDIEYANVYFLKPIDALDAEYNPEEDYTKEQLEMYPDLIEDNALVVGSKHVMNEVAVYMNDDDVITMTGIYPDRCVLIVDLTRDRCKEIIKKGKEIFDRKAKKKLGLES